MGLTLQWPPCSLHNCITVFINSKHTSTHEIYLVSMQSNMLEKCSPEFSMSLLTINCPAQALCTPSTDLVTTESYIQVNNDQWLSVLHPNIVSYIITISSICFICHSSFSINILAFIPTCTHLFIPMWTHLYIHDLLFTLFQSTLDSYIEWIFRIPALMVWACAIKRVFPDVPLRIRLAAASTSL